MSHLHIQNTDKFTEPYIKFINKYFNSNRHLFLVITSKRNFVFQNEYKNVFYAYPRKTMHLLLIIKKMYQSDKIFLHGLTINWIVLLLFLQPWLLKKCSWIVWGGDLYQYKKNRLTIRSKVYEFMRSKVIKNMGELLTIVKGDYELAKKWYHTKAKNNDIKYVNLERLNYINEIVDNENKKSKYTSILVGNSATQSNKHVEAFELLSRFKNENIKIYCPLSYGDSDYANEVIKAGNEMFGDKFIAITKFMDTKQYLDFLNSIDIGVFNNDRQQGLGNITSLLYLGKKVFLRNNTTMWAEYSTNFKLFTISDIKNEDYENFIFYDRFSKKLNQDRMAENFDIKYRIKLWENVFED